MWAKIRRWVGAAASGVRSSCSSLYKVFVSLVLFQFGVLSFLSIGAPASVEALPMCDAMVRSSSFWWGIVSLYGAATLAFEPLIRGCWKTRAGGHSAALLAFLMLSYEFALRNPPIYAGIIFSATSVIFLGGLLYGLVRKRW